VANAVGSVTELDAATGDLVRVLSGSRYKFNNPTGISSDGTHVWVVNADGSVTELDAATGGLVQVLSGSQYGFDDPCGVASDGTHVWVPNSESDSLTEFPASSQ
jgi:DNA-binding beta-propeller fold protein YncE